jgi:hypothetical protein
MTTSVVKKSFLMKICIGYGTRTPISVSVYDILKNEEKFRLS